MAVCTVQLGQDRRERVYYDARGQRQDFLCRVDVDYPSVNSFFLVRHGSCCTAVDSPVYGCCQSTGVQLRRWSPQGDVCCPSPEPGPNWRTRRVELVLCIGRYEGTDMFLGRRGLHCLSAIASTMVTEPQ